MPNADIPVKDIQSLKDNTSIDRKNPSFSHQDHLLMIDFTKMHTKIHWLECKRQPLDNSCLRFIIQWLT